MRRIAERQSRDYGPLSANFSSRRRYQAEELSVDTLSRAFAGNEIDRTQVYAFASHMQALAMVGECSVTVLSHPSLQGMASGTGLSGSTAWHGAFRFRQYLTSVRPIDGEQPDNDLTNPSVRRSRMNWRNSPLRSRTILNGPRPP
jgi:RecA-family ATPase